MSVSVSEIQTIKLNRDICVTQGRIYEQAAYDGCDIKEFSDKYLNSNFCKNRIEVLYSPFQREDAATCLEFIYPEIQVQKDLDSDVIYNPDIAYWIGYTYHLLYCATNLLGKELTKRVPVEKLIVNYKAHHTLDEIQSVHKLSENYKLPINDLYERYERYLEVEQV